MEELIDPSNPDDIFDLHNAFARGAFAMVHKVRNRLKTIYKVNEYYRPP